MNEELSNHMIGQCAEILDTELRRLAWAKHLEEDTLADFITTAKVANFEANAIALDVGQPVTEVFLLSQVASESNSWTNLGMKSFAEWLVGAAP